MEEHLGHSKKEHSRHPAHKEGGKACSSAMCSHGWKIAAFVFAALFIISIVYMIGWQRGASDGTAPTPSASSDTEVTLYIVNDMECQACQTQDILDSLKQNLFSNLDVKEVSYSSKEGKAMIQKYSLTMVPSLLFDKNVADSANYAKIADAVDSVEGMYIVKAGVLRGGKLLSLPEINDGAALGKDNAPVAIIEFSDYQCPYCAKFYVESFNSIKANYIDTGKVKYVHKNYPLSFHENAQKAAEAAECAKEQNKYWEMHDKLFRNAADLAVAKIKGFAKEVGLSQTKFDSCLDTGKYEAKVKKDLSDGMSYGVSGTPAFFINGIAISGAQPYEAFKQIIDAELARSK